MTILRTWTMLLVVAVAVGSISYRVAAEEETPKPELISGEVISLAGYMIKGLHGQENSGSGVLQIEKRSLPVAILDRENDELYLAIYRGTVSAAPKLAPLMGMMVYAQGPIYRKHGVNLIKIQVVSEQ